MIGKIVGIEVLMMAKLYGKEAESKSRVEGKKET